MALTMPDQSGRVVIVTGANSGIGYVMATHLAKAHAHVIVAARSEDKGNAAVKQLKVELGDVKVEFMKLDLASFASIKAFAAAFVAKQLPLHVLINNAGVAFIPQGKTQDGYETVIGVNHLGTFLLTSLLLDVLKASAPSRVVTVASNAAYSAEATLDDILMQNAKAYDPTEVYSASKLYNVMFAYELDRRLKGTGVRSFSCHPGVTSTAIYDKMTAASVAERIVKTLLPKLAQKPEYGAISALFCATSDGVLQSFVEYMYGPNAWINLFQSHLTFNTHANVVANKNISLETNLKLWEDTEKIVFGK